MTRFRAPGGAPDPVGAGEPDEPGYHDREMPVGAVLWTPVDGAGQAAPTVPIFIRQQVLAAVHNQCTAPRGLCFGLLGGDLYRSPQSGVPYVMVESIVRLPDETGQEPEAALSQGWVVAQDVLRRTGVQPVGWYRAGAAAAPEPSSAELETHAALFWQPWQILVTAAPGAVPVGGVYRPSAGDGSAPQPLPFHEVQDPSRSQQDGGKHGRLVWTNYRIDEAASPPASAPAPAGPAATKPPQPVPPPPRPAARRPAPLLFLSDPVDSPTVAPPFRWGMLGLLARHRVVRVATYATGGLLAVFGVLRVFLAAPAALPPPRDPPPAPATLLTQLDHAADTLALAIGAFDLRAQLFSSRQMQCPELARGLVLVEERWAAYNAVRKDGGLVVDSVRTARDRALYADAGAVERRFEASGCPRP